MSLLEEEKEIHELKTKLLEKYDSFVIDTNMDVVKKALRESKSYNGLLVPVFNSEHVLFTIDIL